MTGHHAGRVRACALVSAAIFVLIATRWPLAPRYLYHFDSVNFALALENFNPALHQPQPPGYPLFVGLTKLISLLFDRAEQALLIAGLLVALGAVILIWRLGVEMFNPGAGVLAAALLLCNPPFWLGGLTNQVRVCLAFWSLAIALLAWRALTRNSVSWLYAAFAGVGVAAGFRPDVGVLLLPLLLFVWWRKRGSARSLICCFGITAASAIPWIIPTAIAVGGFEQWLLLMWRYSNDQFQGTSLVFGAAARSARRMAWSAIVWNGMGTLAWLWALPFSVRRWTDRPRLEFLAAWFFPLFLFSAVIHIGDPDQALASIPVLCLIGGAVLESAIVRYAPRARATACVAAAGVNALFFFVPLGRIAAASTYDAVDFMSRKSQAVFDAVSQMHGREPITIVTYNGFVTWRQLSYYFPNDYVLNLPLDPNEAPLTLFHREAIHSQANVLPGTRLLILLAPQLKRKDLEVAGWRSIGSAFVRDTAPGTEVVVGPYRLVHPAPSQTI